MRCAIYARFSSDLQDDRSIGDQLVLAREYAGRRGLRVSVVYEDASISGAFAVNRPGFQKMVADAGAKRFEVVITESLDRLSRGLADIAAFYERMAFLGVRIETLADGPVSEIHVGLKGTMAALFLKDLAQKTRRGQIGRVKAGRIPGGRSYGYDVVPTSENDRGRRVINGREAEIVRRIYAEYAAGKGTLAIVTDLNRDGRPGPSGGAWNVSALIGSPKRRNGVLNNELYNGVIVYNRQRFLKDPATGKRVSRANPESDWVRQEVPELRIVDAEIWHAVQRLRASRGSARPHEMKRPQRLLSGLIFCGCCGSRYNIATKDWLRCSARVNSGTCLESRPIRMAEVEQRVVSSIERHLLTPELVSVAVGAYRDELTRVEGGREERRMHLSTELDEVERKLVRLLRLVEEGHADPAIAGPRLNELTAQKRQLAAELADRRKGTVDVPVGDGVASYLTLVRDLRSELAEKRSGAGEAAALVRGLIRKIVINPSLAGNQQPIEVAAGFSTARQVSNHDCNGGCGGRI